MTEIRRFRMLDIPWTLRSDGKDLAEDLARVFRLFERRAQGESGEDDICFAVHDRNGSQVLSLPDGTSRLLLPAPWTFPHLHMLILTAVFDRVEEYYLIHAASVAHRGKGIAICGPSGFGKTTLTMALYERGWSMLSDEFAVLAPSSGRLLPFPRLPGSRHPEGPDWWSVPDLSGTQKWYPPPESVRTRIAPDAVPLKAVLILQSGNAVSDSGLIVAVRGEEGEKTFRSAAKSAGMNLSPQVFRKGAMIWLQFEKKEAEAALGICRTVEDIIVSVERIIPPPSSAHWSEPPVLKPVPGTLGPLKILPYLRNRGPKSSIFRKAGGNMGNILIYLAAALSDIPVFTLRVGILDEMLDIIYGLPAQ